MKKILLAIVAMAALPFFANAQCTTSNATGCQCKDPNQTDCDLLPDIQIGHPPFYDVGAQYGMIEYSQTGNGADDGRLKITVSTPNPGHGPLELRTTNIFVCGTDTFVGSAPSICPDGISYPRILINQRIYHKTGNTMTSYDRAAGTMTYHPSHGHMHVDDWGVYTLRTRDTLEPNPLNWPIIGAGSKLAFCVMDYGTCPGWADHCLDTAGNPMNNANLFPNYGLGGGGYNCSPTVQGISSGYMDVYWTSLDGMWIDIPPGVCNGDYWVVCEVDPNHNFLEEYENNNVYAAPFTLTKQSPNPNSSPFGISISNSALNLCQGESVTLAADPNVSALSYLWSNGDTTQSTTVSAAGTYTLQVTNSCGTGASVPVTINTFAAPSDPVTEDDTIPTPGTALLTATAATTVNWYDAASGGTLLGSGNLFTTPFINSTTTFWVEASETHAGAAYNVGPVDNNIGQGGYYTGAQSMIFDCYNPFILHAVTVYAQTAGNRTIELQDAQGTTLQTATVSVSSGQNVIVLDFNIAPGTGYQLTRTGSEDLYRNNPGSGIAFPFNISNFCSITGTSAGAGYYYFFYNWDVRLPDNSCTSARVPATAVVTAPNTIADVNILNSLTLFPNPASNDVTVSFSLSDTRDISMQLLDALGKVVTEKQFRATNGNVQEVLSLQGVARGIYSVHILSADKNYYHKLVVR